MKVSKNELTAALKKSFEGLGFSYGDYLDAAAMVTWSEMTGLDGLQTLERALPFIDAGNSQSPALGYRYADSNNPHPVLDAKGASSLLCGSGIVDLACSLARKNHSVMLRVDNCRNRLFALERLSNAGQRGLVAAMGWFKEGCFSWATIGAGQQYPALKQFVCAPIETSLHQSLWLFCSTAEKDCWELMSAALPELANANKSEQREPQTLQQAYADSLEQGIAMPVPLWEKFDLLTARVLVESTESSRAGAGE